MLERPNPITCEHNWGSWNPYNDSLDRGDFKYWKYWRKCEKPGCNYHEKCMEVVPVNPRQFIVL